jgi:hypothetical protein
MDEIPELLECLDRTGLTLFVHDLPEQRMWAALERHDRFGVCRLEGNPVPEPGEAAIRLVRAEEHVGIELILPAKEAKPSCWVRDFGFDVGPLLAAEYAVDLMLVHWVHPELAVLPSWVAFERALRGLDGVQGFRRCQVTTWHLDAQVWPEAASRFAGVLGSTGPNEPLWPLERRLAVLWRCSGADVRARVN